MKQLHAIAIALLPLMAHGVTVDVPIRCGTVSELEVLNEKVSVVDLQKALIAGKLKPEEIEDTSLYVTAAPESGRSFAIVTVKLAKGKSVGKHDYKLVTGEESFACKGLARTADGVFDERLQEVTAAEDGDIVRLLFDVPAGTNEAVLDLVLPLAYPVPDVPLNFVQQVAPPPVESAGEQAGAPADATDIAPDADKVQTDGEEKAPAAAPAAPAAAEPEKIPEPAKIPAPPKEQKQNLDDLW